MIENAVADPQDESLDDSLNASPTDSIGGDMYSHPQSALAMGNGKLAVLIFLSTELMFFAALISSYIVLRFASGPFWPQPSDVHVELWIGILNTVVLISSSFCLLFSVRAAEFDRASSAKRWLFLTGLLGLAFLGIKGAEYFTKIQHGIYPSADRTLIYETADEAYLSRAASEIQSAIEIAEENGISSERLESLYTIKSGIVDWCSFQVSQTGNLVDRKNAVEALAYQINPLSHSERLERYLDNQLVEAEAHQAELSAEFSRTNKQLTDTQNTIKQLLPQRESGGTNIRTRFEKASREAELLTLSLTTIQKELNPVNEFLAAEKKLNRGTGVNKQFGLKLPSVIPGGIAWSNTYYLLTGFHGIHLIAGLLFLAGLMTFRLTRSRVHWLQNFSLYWHFVDLIWIVIFSIVYLT